MATATVGIHLRGSEKLGADYARGNPLGTDTVYLRLDVDRTDEPGGNDLVVFLPHNDEDALLVLELLEASVDNLRSYVELRKSDRLRASLDKLPAAQAEQEPGA